MQFKGDFCIVVLHSCSMNWADLNTLLAVARSETLTAAAATLAVNQTTVSRRLDALEESLGTRLVERDRRGVRLTVGGERAKATAEQMEALVFELERELIGGDARLSGNLRVTTTDTIAAYHPELFSGFAERYPEVALEVATSYRERSLTRREADLAIRWTKQPAEHLFGRKVAHVHYALYAAKPLVARIGLHAKLDRYPWVGWDAASGDRLTDRWVAGNVLNARVVCRYDSALTLHAAVRSGVGAGFVPCAYADAWPELVRIRPVEPSFAYDIWALAPSELATTARVRAFMSHAGEYFGGWKGRFAGEDG